MEIKDLLDWGLKSTESSKESETLRAWLASAVILAHTQLEAGSDRQPLVKHFADLAPEEALRLSSSLPSPASSDIYSSLEKLRHAQTSPNSNATEIYSGLSALRDQIDATTRGRRRWSILLNVLKVAGYVGPVVLAYLVGTYFRFYENLVWDSDAVLSPPATYSLRSGDYEISDGYQARFFKEFSRYYFDRDNAFSEQFVRGRLLLQTVAEQPASESLDSPAKRDVIANLGALRLRLVFRNPRRGEPFLVSSIETTATYRAKPFDWSRVDVSTDLVVNVFRGQVTLSDKGIGPATDVKYAVSAGSMTLYASSRRYILNDPATEYLSSANGDVVSLQTQSDDSGTLEQPVYWFLHAADDNQSSRTTRDADPFTINGTLLTCANGRQYEIVKGADRLAQLTKTVQGGPAKVDVTYESLRGERSAKTVDVTLPADRVFAKGADKIAEQNPCGRRTVELGPPVSLGSPNFAALLDKLDAAPKSVKGVDLIKAASMIDLRHLPDGGSVGVAASPDEILNPAGFARLDLTVANGRNGELELQFKVNGIKLREMKIQLLVPDDGNFEPVTSAKMGHFRTEKK